MHTQLVILKPNCKHQPEYLTQQDLLWEKMTGFDSHFKANLYLGGSLKVTLVMAEGFCIVRVPKGPLYQDPPGF